MYPQKDIRILFENAHVIYISYKEEHRIDSFLIMVKEEGVGVKKNVNVSIEVLEMYTGGKFKWVSLLEK